MASVVCAKKGSMTAESGSGISVMSDSLIARHPAMDEPSNIRPCVNASSSISERSKVTCCHLPRGSVNRRSTNLTSLSLISFRTDFASAILVSFVVRWRNASSDSVGAFFAGPDPDCLLDIEYEYLAVTNASGTRGLQDRFYRRFDLLRHQYDLDFH